VDLSAFVALRYASRNLFVTCLLAAMLILPSIAGKRLALKEPEAPATPPRSKSVRHVDLWRRAGRAGSMTTEGERLGLWPGSRSLYLSWRPAPLGAGLQTFPGASRGRSGEVPFSGKRAMTEPTTAGVYEVSRAAVGFLRKAYGSQASAAIEQRASTRFVRGVLLKPVGVALLADLVGDCLDPWMRREIPSKGDRRRGLVQHRVSP